jgi:uncharacterized damage-inducible protein DinB
MLQIIPLLLKEMEGESVATRKMLTIVPNDKYEWQPHPKSMTIRSLATHIAELPTWVSMGIHTDGLDFATAPYDPVKIDNTDDLLALFEKSLVEAKKDLEATTEDVLEQMWTMRNGEKVYMNISKYELIRTTFGQIAHHRAQLGVFLRLLDIPIPGAYGPSADEMDLW